MRKETDDGNDVEDDLIKNPLVKSVLLKETNENAN
jgi:hypothetical protein